MSQIHLVYPVYGEPFVCNKKSISIIGTSITRVEKNELDRDNRLRPVFDLLRKNQYTIHIADENYNASNDRELPKNKYAEILTFDVELANSSPNELQYAIVNGYKKKRMNVSGNIVVSITNNAFEKIKKNVIFRDQPTVGDETNCYGTKPNLGLPYNWNENQ